MNSRLVLIRRIITEVQVVTQRFTEHRTSLIAGGLAYFVALAVAPAAIVIGGIAGLIIGPADLKTALDEAFAHSPIPTQGMRPITDAILLASASASTGALTLASIISISVAVYASSKVVYGLRMAMDTAFEVRPKYQGIIGRVTATIITLVGLLLVVGAIVTLTVVPRILHIFDISTAHLLTGVGALDWIFAAVLLWLGVRWTMRRAPNSDRAIPITSLGAIGATVWILAASAGVGAYVSFSSTFGAAISLFGTPIVLLLWFYLCFLGLLYGAEVEAMTQRRNPVPGEGESNADYSIRAEA